MAINIISFKASFHADRISKVDKNIAFYTVDKMLKHIGRKKNIFKKDNLIILGFYLRYNSMKKTKDILDLYKKLILAHKNAIIIFAGSDVLHFVARPDSKRLLEFASTNNVRLFAVGENLQKEIKQDMKTEVGVLKLPFNHVFGEPKPLPEKLVVGCYMPTTRSDFYGYSTIIKTIKKNKDIEFHFYANDGISKNSQELRLDNLICHSKPITDMESFIENISCGLRITEHDGNPMTLAEYCANGRYFIYNRPMPFCTLADPTAASITRKLRWIFDNYSRDINCEMSSLYRAMHDKDEFMKNIYNIFKT
jgi:hypothetical protein